MIIELTAEEYEGHREAFDGVCLDCGAWTMGGVEPDAERYLCESCQRLAVMGCEEALVTGHLLFKESES